MSGHAAPLDDSSSSAQPRTQSQQPTAAPAERTLRRGRSRSAASAAPSDGEAERAQSDAGADNTPFEKLPAWKQLVQLTDAEMVGTVLHDWWPGELYLELIDEWTQKQLDQVCERLDIVMSSTTGMRKSIKKRIERWAKDNPLLVPLDSSRAAPRSSEAGAKAAKAAVIAQRMAGRSAPKVQYSEDDGGTATEADDSDADSDYNPSARPDARGRSSARAASHRGAGKHSLSKELVAALSSLPSVSASAPSRDRESARSGRRGAAAPSASAVRASRSHRSRRRDSSPSSSSSSSDSDFDEDSFPSEEEERPTHRPSSRHSSNRGSSSRGKDRQDRDSLVSEWIKNVLVDGTSIYERFTSATAKWSGERNRKEALVLAKIIDLIRSGNSRQALDRAIRRIAGVQAAEQSGSWTMSNVLENNTEAQSFLPARTWNAALKQASRLEAMRKSSQAGGGSGSSAGKDKPKSSGGSSSSSGSYGQSRSDKSSGAHDAKSTGSKQ